MKELISITIPVLDEEETIYAQIVKIRRYLNSELKDFGPIELVIADNGSTDKTKAIAARLCNEFDYVKLVQIPIRGVGAALQESWKTTNADIVGYMDLDLATDISHLRSVFEHFRNSEISVVNGSRLSKGSQVFGRSLLRTTTSKGLNFILRAVFGTKFRDGMCGFKFLRSAVLPTLIENGANSSGWFFSTEILVLAEKLGYGVIEIPVIWTDDPNSKVRIVKLMREYLLAIYRLKKNVDLIVRE